jgi:hypothetical protein
MRLSAVLPCAVTLSLRLTKAVCGIALLVSARCGRTVLDAWTVPLDAIVHTVYVADKFVPLAIVRRFRLPAARVLGARQDKEDIGFFASQIAQALIGLRVIAGVERFQPSPNAPLPAPES